MAEGGDYDERGLVRLPEREVKPLRQIGRRVGYATIMLGITVVVVFLERDGYKDTHDGRVSLLDALYYATVTLSTTGYGDIVPADTVARMTNVLFITPMRVAFLALLVGTTFEVLTRRTRDLLRLRQWRSTLAGHTIVVGYGTKGFTAIETLIAQGATAEDFVVIDPRPAAVAEASRDGYATVLGDATRGPVLRQAGVATAALVIVAANRDDAAVLVSLTVRQHNPTCTLVASVRESENEQLLYKAGATAVITSAEAAGRLLGVAARSPAISEVVNDLLTHGEGLDLTERLATASEVGRNPRELSPLVIAVVRDGRALPYGKITAIAEGDRLVIVTSPG